MPPIKTPKATAGELLRRWCRASELKHGEIAKRLGISPAHLSNISNEADTPSDELKARIYELTGIVWDVPGIAGEQVREEVA